MRRRPILRNTVLFAASGLLERILGAFYRMALARVAGAVTLGLLQMSLPILRFALILGTLGIPKTLARVVAQHLACRNPGEARAALAWSLRTVALTAGGIAAVVAVLAPLGRVVFPDPRVVPLLRWLSPLILFDCLAFILEAGLHGRCLVWPLVAANIAGQAGKVFLGLAMVRAAAAAGPGAMARASLMATTISAAVILALLAVFSGPWIATDWRPVESQTLFRSSLPLMGDGLVFAAANAIDMVIVPYRLLCAGHPAGAVTGILGQAWGMALPTVFLPMVAVWPLVAANMPVISAAAATGNLGELRRRIGWTYAVTGGIAFVSTALFLLFAESLMALIYACPAAGHYLRLFAWVACPVYLASIGASILTGLGWSNLLFGLSLAGVLVRISLIYILSGLPGFGVAGAAAGIAAANGLLAAAYGCCLFGLLSKKRHPVILRPADGGYGVSVRLSG